jgi:hypothetical protein
MLRNQGFPGSMYWSVEDYTLLEHMKKVLRAAIEVFSVIAGRAVPPAVHITIKNAIKARSNNHRTRHWKGA